MAETVFLVDIGAEPGAVRDALSTQDGIVGWWTTRANVPDTVGETLSVGFPEAPIPFELRVEEVGDERIRWTSVGEFPPHWKGTEVVWNLMPNPDAEGTRLFFEHRGFAAADPALGFTALTWASLMHRLKAYAETGDPDPHFP